MSYFIIGIWLALALSVVCFLSWEIIYTKGLWYLKATSSAVVIALIFFSVYTWREIQGTPKFVKNPDGMIVRSYMIKEPKKAEKGKIWLWITNPEKRSEPYNIEIPYSKDTHKKLMENRGLAEGRAQLIKRTREHDIENSNAERQFVFEDVIKQVPKEINK
jgi:hypothetical protein